MNKEVSGKKYLVIIFVLLFIFSLFLYNMRFNNKVDNINYNVNKIKLLNDYSRFFTVNSCIYKYVNYVQSKNVENILKVLDNDYKMSKNINKNNIFDNIETLNSNYSFVSKKIYYEEIDEYNFKYYVYGYLEEDTIDGYGEKFDRYYIVKFDTKKSVFSITPYSEMEFKEVTNG